MKAVPPRGARLGGRPSARFTAGRVRSAGGGAGGRGRKFREARATSVPGSGCTAGSLSPHFWDPRSPRR